MADKHKDKKKSSLEEENLEMETKNSVEREGADTEFSQYGEQSDNNQLLKEKELENFDLNNKLTRLQADFQNYKRRSDREKEQSVNFGIETVVLELLPILDNFQRAIDSHEDKEDSFFKGIEMIEKQLFGLLELNSVVEIPAIGEKFDPNLHHAVSVLETGDQPETIVEVLQKGYKFKEKVIRPSMVIVAK